MSKIPASEYVEYDKFIKDAEPCEDCVSRTDIKKIAKEMYLEVGNMELDVHTISDCISYTASKCRQVLVDKLNNLSLVTPKPRTGKWIDKKPNLQSPFAKMYWCDQCGAHAYKSAYCPGCGAKMEGVSE